MDAHFRRFFRSPLGLSVLGSDALLALVLSAMGVLSPWAALPLCAALYIVEALVLMQTPLGSSAIAGEADRERAERDARILGAVGVARKRLSLIKPADRSIAASVERLILASGHYLEACVKGSDRDPIVEDAILGAVEAVDDYMRMLDVRSIEKRMREVQKGLKQVVDKESADTDTVDKESADRAPDAAGDSIDVVTVRVLDKAAQEIETRLQLHLGGVKGGTAVKDRIDAREDML